jgi:hypothetical protein
MPAQTRLESKPWPVEDRLADGLRALTQRVSKLDGEPMYADAHGEIDVDVAHFIHTLDVVTPMEAMEARERDQLPVVSAEEADAVIERCELLGRLAKKAPEIVLGPLIRCSQYWVATGRPDYLPSRVRIPDPSQLVEVSDDTDMAASTKPFYVGLHTSTGFLGTFGMWLAHLTLKRGSTLYPLPWHVWSVQVREDARILGITNATEWVRFVLDHPLHRGPLVYPDWKLVADSWDGVHLTVRAIAAAQGIWFSVGRQLVAAPYWGVESTFWLRWSFASTNLVQEIA